MFIPKKTNLKNKSFKAGSEVYLEAKHIIIKKNIAEKIFGNDAVVLSTYYINDKTFLVAPASEELFRMIHKGTQQILKNKNAFGDKSISVQELLLDNDIDNNDRNLAFTLETSLHILKVQL